MDLLDNVSNASSVRSTASSGVSDVITPEIQGRLNELKTLLNTIVNDYYSSEIRGNAAQHADDLIFALEQYKRGAMLNTSMYISSRGKVTRHQEEIQQRTKDTQTLSTAINNAKRTIDNRALMGEIEALNRAIQAAIDADNQDAFEALKQQIFDKINRIGQLTNIEHRDRMIILSNFDKSLTQLEGHGQNRVALGDSLPAVNMTAEALAIAQTNVSLFNFSLFRYVNRGLTSMFNVASTAGYMFLGATRGLVLGARLGARALTSGVRDVSRSDIVNDLAAYGSAALQTTALAISNMLKDSNIPEERRQELRQGLNNFDPELARLIIGVADLPLDNFNVDPNLLIAQAAFDIPGSASSSIASSLVPSRAASPAASPAASAAASPAASQQEAAMDILAPTMPALTMPALTEEDVYALERAISRSSSGSSATSVTTAQSIVSGMAELRNFRDRIESIQKKIQGEQQIEPIGIDLNDFTFQLGDDNIIDNAEVVSSNFLKAVEPFLQDSASARSDVNMYKVAEQLLPYAEEESMGKAMYAEQKGTKRNRSPTGSQETPDSQGPQTPIEMIPVSYNMSNKKSKGHGFDTEPDTDLDFGGGHRKKSRHQKKSKKTKRRQQRGGKHKKNGRKTMRRHKRRTMKCRK